jgi:hypothetical protein
MKNGEHVFAHFLRGIPGGGLVDVLAHTLQFHGHAERTQAQSCVRRHLLANECLSDENGQNDRIDEHATESRYDPLPQMSSDGTQRMSRNAWMRLQTWGIGLPRKSLREQVAASGAAAVTPTAATASFNATTNAAT